MTVRACPGCGVAFGPHPGEGAAEYRRRRYCSRTCGRRAVVQQRADIRAALALRATDMGWQRAAACQRAPAWLFNAGNDGGDEATALSFCGLCPVQGPCLDWASRNGESGTWGGLTERQRAAMTKARIRA